MSRPRIVYAPAPAADVLAIAEGLLPPGFDFQVVDSGAIPDALGGAPADDVLLRDQPSDVAIVVDRGLHGAAVGPAPLGMAQEGDDLHQGEELEHVATHAGIDAA